MNNNEIKKQFIKFLRDKHCTKAYVRAFREGYLSEDFRSASRCVDHWIQRKMENALIDLAFTWRDTREGAFFWSVINSEWIELINDES